MISQEGSSLKERQKECNRIDGEIKKSCDDRNKGDKIEQEISKQDINKHKS